MLTKLRTFASLYRELGLRWLAFRLTYAFRLRTGLIRWQMPQYQWDDRPLETWLRKNIPSTPKSYAQWRKQHSPKFFFDDGVGAGSPRPMLRWNQQPAISEANRLLNGEIKYFSHQFNQVGFPPNWHKDPLSGIELDSKKHWSKYSDDADLDIKFIWEANRFSFVYTIVRAYTATHDEKYAEAFWQLTESWAESNPPNTGPNWMDGQELALRLMAWTFGLYGFTQSPASTPQRLAQLTVLIASHAERIYKNTSFAISTHGNHSITEALGLWTTGLLFPELKHADKYLAFGYISLEREARAQIFSDGTYSMYSLNYHRFILHIYLYAMRLGEISNFPLSTHLQNLIAKSLEYLSHLIDPQTGQMPVYGSNDGALVLPLNNCDFIDYRPLLQLGWYITKKEFLLNPGPWDEDIFWLCGVDSLSSRSIPERDKRERVSKEQVREKYPSSFPQGGTYLLHSSNSHALLRCTDFRARPSHADQLHMDLWIHGHNLAVDAGTYLYSGPGVWRNGLAHTSVHNTVTVDNKDQMTMASRFTWMNWSKGRVLKHDKDLWQGEHDGYRPVSHRRTVMALEDDHWLVIDDLVANEPHQYTLHWLLSDGEYGIRKPASGFGLWLEPSTSKLVDSKFNIQMGLFDGNGIFSLVRADANSVRGWRSRYYGHKEPAISVMLEVNQAQVAFWSFFGLENDVVEVVGKSIKVNSKMIEM